MPVQKKSLISTRTAAQKAIIASKPDLNTKTSQPLTVAKPMRVAKFTAAKPMRVAKLTAAKPMRVAKLTAAKPMRVAKFTVAKRYQ